MLGVCQFEVSFRFQLALNCSSLRDLYFKFGRVTGNSARRRRQIYKEQWHLRDHLETALPLENDEYSKLPGNPEWNDDDLLDEYGHILAAIVKKSGIKVKPGHICIPFVNPLYFSFGISNYNPAVCILQCHC